MTPPYGPAALPDTGAMQTVRRSSSSGQLLTVGLFGTGAALLLFTYGSLLPIVFPLLLAVPVVGFFYFKREQNRSELTLFARSFATGTLAAGIASYFAIVLLDPYQLGSDAWSFFQLSSQAGPARTLQDLRTITEGAGAVVLWSWFYDFAALLGFPRDMYIGISVNILIVAIGAAICARSAKLLYGDDEYRIRRLTLFFTIAGNMWLFAGLHIRDSVIFLMVVILAHFWIAYLAELKQSRIVYAVAATLLAMPALEVLRKEFFYVPLMIGFSALACLNFTRGRGDARFITLVSVLVGASLAVVGLIAFGSELQDLFTTGQRTYTDSALAEARSGSLGNALIVEQTLFMRIALGLPYLLYFPIPFWGGFEGESALQLFKSINAIAFYYISGLLFVGGFLILKSRQLRSPAFLFVLAVPFIFGVSVVLTSLESRHLGAFLSMFFLVALMPDMRNATERRYVRFSLVVIVLAMTMVHAAWFALRYG